MGAPKNISAHYLADRAIGDPVQTFAGDVERVKTGAELDAVMARYLRAFGISHHAFYVGTDRFKRPAVRSISGTTHKAWRKHYDGNNLGQADELLKSGLTSDAPTTWRRFREQRALTRPQERIYHEAGEFNLKDGFFLPLHQPDGSMLGITMMVPHAMPTDSGTLAILHMLSIYYTLAAKRVGLLAGIQGEDGERALTRRQAECLQWIAAGKSSWEISEILGISEYTVNEHLAAARQRLGVRTTTQAAIRAVVTGQITP